MDTGVVVALLSAIGMVGVGILTTRQNRASVETTNALERDKVSQSQWATLMEELRQQRDEAITARNNDRERLSKLEEALAVEQRTRQGEAKAAADWRRMALAYIHDLREALEAADVAVPAPPDGLDIDGAAS